MSAPSTVVASLTIPADAGYLGMCRLAAAGIGGSAGLSDERIADLQLAVSEVCADAVLHARPPSTICVRMRLPDGEVEFAVESVADAGRSLPELLTTLLDRLSSRWHVTPTSNGGTVVTFAVPRPAG